MAERPGRLKINIEKTNRNEPWNKAGIFRFYWHDRGKLVGVNIDSSLPMIDYGANYYPQ